MAFRKVSHHTLYPCIGIILIALICFFLGGPILALFIRVSPSTLLGSLNDPVVFQALILSFVTSFFTVVIIVLFGTPAIYHHCKWDYHGKSLVDAIIDLPLILPPAVAGVALLMLWGRMGILGSYLHLIGIDIAFTTIAVVIAQIFVACPLYLRQAKEIFTMIDPSYEHCARTLGSSSMRTFWYIILPLTRESLLSASILTGARALGEFGATIMFAGNLPGVTQTMPLAIYSAMQGDIDAALTLSVILVLISFGIMIFIRLLSRRVTSHA